MRIGAAPAEASIALILAGDAPGQVQVTPALMGNSRPDRAAREVGQAFSQSCQWFAAFVSDRDSRPRLGTGPPHRQQRPGTLSRQAGAWLWGGRPTGGVWLLAGRWRPWSDELPG